MNDDSIRSSQHCLKDLHRVQFMNHGKEVKMA
ncbi:hypothetical protein SAMN05216332_10596 [Nitrosospira briensis]|nr:hypothetical protein SAMN05216332_10596 [Nitrosospira briensis]